MLRTIVAGRRLETQTIPARRADRPAIVMLHEGLGSLALWRDLPNRLAAATGCAVVTYSRYGYGRSEPLHAPRDASYMHDEGERVLPALLAALGIERPVLFGHSDGASIALLYAAAHPAGAHALVLEAPHVFVEDCSVRSIAAAKDAFVRGDLRAKLARWHDDVDRTFYGWNDIWLDPRFRDWNIESALDAIRCPVLLIQGDADEYGTAAQLDAVARRVPAVETMLVPGAGHSPHRDAPDAVVARVVSFLAEVG